MDTTNYKSVRNCEKSTRHFYRQLCLSFIGMSFGFTVGMCLGTPTVAVPQLKQQANSTSAVSDEMASWITSITSYAGIIWAIILTTLAQQFGRKIPMVITGISTFAASLLVYCSKDVIHILISQSIYGIAQAAHTTVCIMVITEYTSPKYRGVFLTLKAASNSWGTWVANAIGIFSHYKYIGLVGIGCSFYNLITLIFMPESPYWLASQEKYHECAVAHHRLKGKGEESEKELDCLIRSWKEKNECEKVKLRLFDFVKYYASVIRKPEIFKPIILSLLVIFMLHFSGKLVCTAYSVEIMTKITNSSSAAHIGVLVLDGFTVAGTYAGCFLSKVLKRRTLLFGASSGCAVFLLLLSLYLFLVKLTVILENHYVSITLLVAYSLAASCGPLILVTTLFGEMSPLQHRSFTVVIISIESKIVMGTLFKIGPFLFKTFGMDGSFLFFGVILTVCTILGYKYIPETKDKTLQEIAEYFCSKKWQPAAKCTPLVNPNA